MDCAASRGSLKTVQFLHENQIKSCTSAAMTWAAQPMATLRSFSTSTKTANAAARAQ